MPTRLVVIEVADTKSEDMLRMAISQWNEVQNIGTYDTLIHHRFLYSCPVGNQQGMTP